jgi:nucleoid DNA-binding protein
MAKAATKAPAAAAPAAGKAPSKSEVFARISEATGVSKKEVAAVFEALGAEIGKALSKKGPGVFQIPGLCKIKLKYTPAKRNTKASIASPAKPAPSRRRRPATRSRSCP